MDCIHTTRLSRLLVLAIVGLISVVGGAACSSDGGTDASSPETTQPTAATQDDDSSAPEETTAPTETTEAGAQETEATEFSEQEYLEALRTRWRNALPDSPEATYDCIAESNIGIFGVDKLNEQGVTPEDLVETALFEAVEVDAATRQALIDASFDCIP